jgi:hypothetical protein
MPNVHYSGALVPIVIVAVAVGIAVRWLVLRSRG